MRTSGMPPAITADTTDVGAGAPETRLRELDHRSSDGIDVRLLWDPQTNRASVAVTEEQTGSVLTFPVDGAEALTAFRDPYAYALHALA
jgi:hypothetical protein